MDSPSYKEKLQSIRFAARPKTKKVTPVHSEETGEYGGYQTERGKPGTGVSEGIDATVQAGKAYVNKPWIERVIREERDAS